MIFKMEAQNNLQIFTKIVNVHNFLEEHLLASTFAWELRWNTLGLPLKDGVTEEAMAY